MNNYVERAIQIVITNSLIREAHSSTNVPIFLLKPKYLHRVPGVPRFIPLSLTNIFKFKHLSSKILNLKKREETFSSFLFLSDVKTKSLIERLVSFLRGLEPFEGILQKVF